MTHDPLEVARLWDVEADAEDAQDAEDTEDMEDSEHWVCGPT